MNLIWGQISSSKQNLVSHIIISCIPEQWWYWITQNSFQFHFHLCFHFSVPALFFGLQPHKIQKLPHILTTLKEKEKEFKIYPENLYLSHSSFSPVFLSTNVRKVCLFLVTIYRLKGWLTGCSPRAWEFDFQHPHGGGGGVKTIQSQGIRHPSNLHGHPRCRHRSKQNTHTVFCE